MSTLPLLLLGFVYPLHFICPVFEPHFRSQGLSSSSGAFIFVFDVSRSVSGSGPAIICGFLYFILCFVCHIRFPYLQLLGLPGIGLWISPFIVGKDAVLVKETLQCDACFCRLTACFQIAKKNSRLNFRK